MLGNLQIVSAVLFNLISAAAIAVAGWWFIQRGKLRSLLDIRSEFAVLRAQNDKTACKFSMDIANVGASSVKISQIALRVDWLKAENIVSGGLSAQRFPATEYHNVLSSEFFVVPAATSKTSIILTSETPADFCIIRWHLFYGRPARSVKDIATLEEFLKKPRYYYYDEVIFPILDQNATTHEGTTTAQHFASPATRIAPQRALR